MDPLSSRFLTAYNDIDACLRRKLNVSRDVSFRELLRRFANKGCLPHGWQKDLELYADLRNIIVHAYGGPDTLATPKEEVVKRIESIRDRLVSPPPVGSLFNCKVETCAPDTAVGVAVRIMQAANFSQLPVYAGEEFHGLLTTDTVARWLAAAFDRNDGIAEQSSVKSVLEHAEYHDNHAFLRPSNSVFEAIALFAEKERSGKRLYAVLITADGTEGRSPSGIITTFDIPKLYQAAE